MNKRVFFMVALLLLCALIFLQQDVDATLIEVVGSSTQRTLTTDTENVIFTVRFTGETGELRQFVYEAAAIIESTGTEVNVVLRPKEDAPLSVADGETHDVTLRVNRKRIPNVRDQINITFQGIDALETTYVFQVNLTIAVRTPTDPVADISLGVDGKGSLIVPPSDIADETFTLTLDNNGNANDTISVALVPHSTFYEEFTNVYAFEEEVAALEIAADMALLSLSSTSVTVAPNGQGTLTLRIPGRLIRKYNGYAAIVTATSGADSLFTSTTTVWVNVRGTRSGMLLEGLGDLTQTSKTTDIEDITYTLRATNTGDSLDGLDFVLVSDAIDTATLSSETLTLFPDSDEDIILTIPRTALSQAGTYQIYVIASSQNDSSVSVKVLTETIIIDDTATKTEETDETEEAGGEGEENGSDETDEIVLPPKIIFSEFMFVAGEDETGLPQWIEVYNDGGSEVNLRGWKLQLKSLEPSSLDVTVLINTDFLIPAQQARVVVTALGRHSGGGNLSNDAVYELLPFALAGPAQEALENQIQHIAGDGFSVKLSTSEDVLIDHIGTLSGDEKTWELPECLIEGVRSSLIRRFDEGEPRSGIERRGWVRAYDTKNLAAGIYYGSPQDIGTPGYRRGKPVPVELSQFSAKSVSDEVVISWTTESELDNAGFNIFRSTSRTQNFQRINVRLIEGAGTTGERTQYQFIDKTVKPDVVYYYRLEDVDFSGTRGILTTYRLRGIIAPTGKRITTWGTVKAHR